MNWIGRFCLLHFAFCLSGSRAVILLGFTLLAATPALWSADIYRLTCVDVRQLGVVTVNGFPLQQFVGTNSLTVNTILDPWLFRGENTFVVAAVDPTNNFANVTPGTIRLRLEYGIDAVPTNQPAVQRTVLFEWERQTSVRDNVLSEAIDFKAGSPFHFFERNFLDGVGATHRIWPGSLLRQSEFTVTPGLGSTTIRLAQTAPRLVALPWQGDAIVLTEADRVQLAALVGALHAALAAKDLNAFLPLVRLKTERLATAFGLTVEAQEAVIRGQLSTEILGLEGFSMLPLEPQAFDYTSHPGANLVQVRVRGEEPIMGAGGGIRFRLTVFASKLGGTWKYVE